MPHSYGRYFCEFDREELKNEIFPLARQQAQEKGFKVGDEVIYEPSSLNPYTGEIEYTSSFLDPYYIIGFRREDDTESSTEAGAVEALLGYRPDQNEQPIARVVRIDDLFFPQDAIGIAQSQIRAQLKDESNIIDVPPEDIHVVPNPEILPDRRNYPRIPYRHQ